MHVNEQKILNVLDKLSILEKQHKINKKKGIENLLADIPAFINFTY